MKLKTSELTGAALDWAVEKAELDGMLARGERVKQWVIDRHATGQASNSYSTCWLWGGPIIEREGITTEYTAIPGSEWAAYMDGEKHEMCSSRALVAAMRCYVASTLGAEVEVPDEITN